MAKDGCARREVLAPVPMIFNFAAAFRRFSGRFNARFDHR
jgi:hypothetical protein